MNDANRRALLGEVRRAQSLCHMFRIAIMVAVRHCTYPRWVPYRNGDGSIFWEHERLAFRESLTTPFSHELDDARTFTRRMQARETVRSVQPVEMTVFADDLSFEDLLDVSLTFTKLVPALQIIVWHAQEYGVCWSWLKAGDGPPGTEKFTASFLNEVLPERSVGNPTDGQFALRVRAADWLEKAKIVYVGDERRPADRPAPPHT